MKITSIDTQWEDRTQMIVHFVTFCAIIKLTKKEAPDERNPEKPRSIFGNRD